MANFEESFRLISERKVGGGQKATASDEKVFVGKVDPWLGVKIRTRIKLNEPRESFYTSSNMRLRDSKVGQSGHHIHVEVFGLVELHDLHDLRVMVAEADAHNRSVVVVLK
jgi:hypothetical protein